MGDRWVLGRAGIVNVYQYGDEILHFGGGRLLLRGVNGSGKSTAMNMLLPFLLEADTRRIDAAGEQSGVLRSWMLSGRDEQQPVGYLWVELERGGDEHLTFGCGIRANRSTDRVTTWWFVTPRRPGVDLALVENRTPLSIDALRVSLGPNAVYSHDQRAAYRVELRSRLYGGADIDQHLRLLHVVRNPRVGDRVDLDLPGYMTDALPQLSETALDDAAQPLEDLEEHRRNVEELRRTASVLDALGAVYRGYARTELLRRADELLALVDEHRRRERDIARARTLLGEARERTQAADGLVVSREAEARRLGREIAALTSRDAYKAGQAELEPLRKLVGSRREERDRLAVQVTVRRERQQSARRVLDEAHRRTEDDAGRLARVIADLSGELLAAGVSTRAPAPPVVVTRPLHGAVGDTGEGGATGEGDRTSGDGHAGGDDGAPVDVPVAPLDVGPVEQGLAGVRGGIATRRAEVEEVRRALAKVEQEERRLTKAEDARKAAEAGVEQAREVFGVARRSRDDAVGTWRRDLGSWIERLDGHRRAHGLPAVGGDDLLPADLAGERESVLSGLHELAQEAVDHHQKAHAELVARRAGEAQEVADLEERLAELRVRRFPEPPATPWQRPDRRACLAELIDFRPEVGEPARAGLEAAMEAAGLLGAEVAMDGSLRLADGELVVAPGPPVARSLAAFLTVTVPENLHEDVDGHVVARILEAISTRPEDLASSRAAPTAVVTDDGRFRTGVLRAQHAKATPEHIGVTARRAALQRLRAEAEAQLTVATRRLEETDGALRGRDEHRRAAVALRQALPPATAVTDALARLETAEQQLARARAHLDTRHTEYLDAEATHRDAVERCRRTAATLGLPPDPAGLDDVRDTLRAAGDRCAIVGERLRALARSVDEWRQRHQDWGQACADVVDAARRRDEVASQHDEEATMLATLEDAIGVEYREIASALQTSEADLARTTNELKQAREEQLGAHMAVERLATELAAAERRASDAAAECIAMLPLLRDALSVPGLVAATVITPVEAVSGNGDASARSPGPDGHTAPTLDAADPTPPAVGDGGRPADVAFPVVPDSPAGARQLSEAVRARIPPPEAGSTSAESLRQSLRQRRDALGAGWDAEDRQPDETLPLHVEVTGPLGRMPLPDAVAEVGSQLRSLTGLLTAKQHQALRNLLEGLVAREVAAKLHAARELVTRMNKRLDSITTSHGIGVSLRWQRRNDLDAELADTIGLLAKPPDLRTHDEDQRLTAALSQRIAAARQEQPEASYRELIAQVLDYRTWHRMAVMIRRPGRSDERLTRRTALSEGEKKMVSYLPLFAAVAASCDALAESAPAVPRFVLLDDAFAKVSADNHAKLFGLLTELDLDFIATSERLWGTHDTVPELAITEVLRDADLGIIVLEHSRWDGRQRVPVP